MRKVIIFLTFLGALAMTPAALPAQSRSLRISLQKIAPSEEDPGFFIRVNDIQQWKPEQTAIIICDMWNEHWCKGATRRVAEMAPVMNNVISIAREKGVLIVHAPSECIDYYKDHPGRRLAIKYGSKKYAALINDRKLDSEKESVWPIDQSDEGCDCSPECKLGTPWTHETDLLEISDSDAISDSGSEIAGLFYKKGIKNVILMGVHTNMCVIGRSFGLRNMIRLGFNVALMRDMTDTMYDSKQWPNVSHFTGNSLMIEYIEKYVCPTLVSTDLTGQKQFRFREDNRPVVAFIIAENEYHANRRLPEFGHELLLTRGVNCEYALGKPVYTGEGIHNIENLQILKDADLMVVQVRRRALPSEQMDLVKDYVGSGKPVLGLRTASHAFSVNQPKNGVAAELPDQWPEFDLEVLGGNYKNHYGTMPDPIVYSIVPGMDNHLLLKGVPAGDFTGIVAPLNSLYMNRPLRSPNIQVILTGSIPGKPSEPVLWINNRQEGKVIYTSMGHWLDWDLQQFRQIMFNAVDILLNLPQK
ncbi:MAG TPA: isochorismatase family protein [Bacteroidales bacterium]|nr:isochorismatase family protein [Bacteroidales bacterium]